MFRISFFTILLISSLFISTSFAQDYSSYKVIDYAKPGEYVIDSINIRGIVFLDTKVIESMTGFRIGDKISLPSEDITQMITKFWDQDLFADIKVSIRVIETDRISLDIYFKERPRLAKLDIEGISKSDITEMKEMLNLRSGSQITDNVLDNIKIIIKKYYLEKGFFNTTIGIKQTQDSSRNRVNLLININKNKKVKIKEIYFSGNVDVPDKKLRKAMKKTKRRDWNIFNTSKYIANDFKDDKALLIDYYNEKGYRDAKILSDSIHVLSTKRISLYIYLFEGHKYYIRDIKWVGNTIYPSEFLSQMLKIKKGDIFNQKSLDKRLQQDEDAVSSLYLDNGYLFFNVSPVEIKIENDSIDFEMRIYEGKQATINEIIIKGNTKTNEHVIRREIKTLPGELFSKKDIIRSVRELATLGHFEPERIEPNPIPNQANGTVDIEYNLIERANDQLEVSGGYGAGMFIGTIGLKFSNFSAKSFLDPKAWRPIPSGDGQTLSLRAQTNGQYYRSFSISFVEPWLGGKKPISLSVSATNSKMTRSTGYSYSGIVDNSSYIKINGISVGLGRRLRWPDDYFLLSNELSYQNYNLKNFDGYFEFNNGSSNNLYLTTTLSRNSYDQLIYPRSGSNFSLGVQLTAPYSLFNNKDYATISIAEKYKWIEYHKWTFKSDFYQNLVGDLVLFVRGQFGALGMYNHEVGYSPFEKFDLGGSGMSSYTLIGTEIIAMRGYDEGVLTPRNINGSKQGNIYDKFTMELRFPITLKEQAVVYLLALAEGGNAWGKFSDVNPFNVKRAAGVGIRAFLPMLGMLGFDVAQPFDPLPGEKKIGKLNFQFIIGQQF